MAAGFDDELRSRYHARRKGAPMAKGQDKPKKDKKVKLTIQEKQKKKKEKLAAKGK